MNAYEQAEKELEGARKAFKDAFDSIRNAKITKSQRNEFAMRFKYPLSMAVCAAVIAAIVVIQVVFAQYDWLYIVCEAVICVAMVSAIVILSVTWFYTRRNAKAAERITYYSPEEGVRYLYTAITGGGEKVEWADASLYLRGNEAELFEGNGKEYNPYLYKKIRGHSRGYVFLSSENLLGNFFSGYEVLSREGGAWKLSSGFSFKLGEDGRLLEMEIKGMYNECYENNFPLVALFPVSRSYTFTYKFSEVNVPNFRMYLPEVTRTACEFYFIPPPQDKGIVVPR